MVRAYTQLLFRHIPKLACAGIRGTERLPGQVRRAALETDKQAVVIFIVDSAALEPDYPLLVVHLGDLSHESFRCVANEL
ncbi:DUF6924 domain-containing protein [Arthrobacter sp. ZBG10]|uniref:DUF6924 domain-containing protein n=1 Tax=Arthrobacter sp. ZBG10 TaxID=1676590 RepID=UPI003FA48478